MSGVIANVGDIYKDTDKRVRRTVRVWAILDDGRIAVQDTRTNRINKISPVRFHSAFTRIPHDEAIR